MWGTGQILGQGSAGLLPVEAGHSRPVGRERRQGRGTRDSWQRGQGDKTYWKLQQHRQTGSRDGDRSLQDRKVNFGKSESILKRPAYPKMLDKHDSGPSRSFCCVVPGLAMDIEGTFASQSICRWQGPRVCGRKERFSSQIGS